MLHEFVKFLYVHVAAVDLVVLLNDQVRWFEATEFQTKLFLVFFIT